VGIVLLEILAGLILVTGWYVCFVRYNRRQATEVILWIKTAFCGHAQILGVQWTSPSRFEVKLRLSSNVFQQASILVRLMPREFALNWLISKLRNQQELATFEADLDIPPSFNLEVQNQRWYGRTRRRAKLHPEHGTIETCGPFVLTTRRDWQREITSMMNALVASRDSDFQNVSFRRSSPHFAATVSLKSLAPQRNTGNDIFHVLRELADCAGASRF
jgi:hypothetical protein